MSFVGGLCAGRTGLVLTKKTTIIGRGDDCDIILEGETLSRRHCTITQWGSVYVLQDTSRNGTYVNGERVVEGQLRDHDQIRVGQNLLLVSLNPRTATRAFKSQETTPLQTAWVIELKPHIVVNGLEAGVTRPFSEERITIGRREDNHLVLDEDNISRQHVAFERRDDEEYYVVDLGSANGTYVNDERVENARLHHGDRVRIGNYVLQVTLREKGLHPELRSTRHSFKLVETGMIGRTIGNYEVVSQFGEGGMGELFFGRHTRLAREVIIKTIRTEDFTPKQIDHLRDRLEREAFVQSQLDHVNIVRVYDFVALGDTTCMVMEYVPGRDLRKMIIRETGPIPASRAIHLFKQVLAAINYAHCFVYSDPAGQKHQGIIHRDLKPANILVTPDDVVKVTDFGIVKLKGVKGGTQLGFNPGTPEYMSPEQALGRELDQRSDIYSLGVVFYEMLTGRVPFEDSGSGTSDYAIRKGHIELPVPPPSQFYPAISPELEKILLRALEKNPDLRFQEARDFLNAIDEYERTGLATGALRTPQPRQTVVQRNRSVSDPGGTLVDTALSDPRPRYAEASSSRANETVPAKVSVPELHDVPGGDVKKRRLSIP
jgi:serine/threonine protein kinase